LVRKKNKPTVYRTSGTDVGGPDGRAGGTRCAGQINEQAEKEKRLGIVIRGKSRAMSEGGLESKGKSRKRYKAVGKKDRLSGGSTVEKKEKTIRGRVEKIKTMRLIKKTKGGGSIYFRRGGSGTKSRSCDENDAALITGTDERKGERGHYGRKEEEEGGLGLEQVRRQGSKK